MNKAAIAIMAMFATTVVTAANLSESDRLICSTGRALMCFEEGECLTMVAFDVGIPDFILVDLNKQTLSAVGITDAERLSPIGHLNMSDGVIYIQGNEKGRAYSAVIDQITGRMSSAIASDGVTITFFGACTHADGL